MLGYRKKFCGGSQDVTTPWLPPTTPDFSTRKSCKKAATCTCKAACKFVKAVWINLQVIYGTKEIFALAQDVFDTLWQEERELLVKIQRPLMSGTTAVDPTLFSPDIIVLNDEKGSKARIWHFKENLNLFDIAFQGCESSFLSSVQVPKNLWKCWNLVH